MSPLPCLYCTHTTHQTCLCGAHQCPMCASGLCPLCIRMLHYNTRLLPRAMRTRPLRAITCKLSSLPTHKLSRFSWNNDTITAPTLKLRRVKG